MLNSQTIYSRRLVLCLVLALTAIIAFAFQGSRGLWDPDEGRYTNVALEMIHSGDYLTPRRHHESMHVTKPPVTYWAIAASAEIFGENEWAFRTPMALAFILTVYLVYELGKSFAPGRPWFPALIYLCSPVPLLAANAITTDTLLACAETAAVLCYANFRFSGKHRYWLDAMWAIFGFAFMIKGPPALMPLLAIVVWEWRASRFKSLVRPVGWIFFIVLGFTWFIWITSKHPELLRYFFDHELVERVATASHDRHGEWYGGLLVYLPTLALGSLPWGCLVAWRRWFKQERIALPAASKFLWLWLLLPLAVFMLARSRLPFYLLPLFVPMSLLLAQSLQELHFRKTHLAFIMIWLSAMTAGKAYIAHVEHGQDARRLAREIRLLLPTTPKEIVFVDGKASYGLHYYLGAEIEKISTADLNAAGLPSDAEFDQDLRNELFEAESDRYFLVPEKSRDNFVKVVLASKMHPQLLGRIKTTAVYEIREK